MLLKVPSLNHAAGRQIWLCTEPTHPETCSQ